MLLDLQSPEKVAIKALADPHLNAVSGEHAGVFAGGHATEPQVLGALTRALTKQCLDSGSQAATITASSKAVETMR
jgi:Flp pilus assembly secretin CpaC